MPMQNAIETNRAPILKLNEITTYAYRQTAEEPQQQVIGLMLYDVFVL